MNKIIVNKTQLLEALRINRTKHVDIFQQAIEKYREQAIVRFEEYIAQIKAGKSVPRALPLPMPEEHTDDYDRAIQMLEWHLEADVSVTEQEFRQYVQDQWGWYHSFAANSASYTTAEEPNE